jgi:hypothetical protein
LSRAHTLVIAGCKFIPGNRKALFDPTIFRIKFTAKGKAKTFQGQLPRTFVSNHVQAFWSVLPYKLAYYTTISSCLLHNNNVLTLFKDNLIIGRLTKKHPGGVVLTSVSGGSPPGGGVAWMLLFSTNYRIANS